MLLLQPRSASPNHRALKVNAGAERIELVAVPYDTSASAFYFQSLSAYESMYEQRFRRSGVEEYKIQFIEGAGLANELFRAMAIAQGSIGYFFDSLELSDDEQRALIVLLDDLGMNYEEARENVDDVRLYEGSKGDYAYELLEDVGISDDLAEMYFDYDAWGRDVRIEGSATSGLEEDRELYERVGNSDEAAHLQEEIDRIDALSDEELAHDIIDASGSLHDTVRVDTVARYFDYDAFARDLDMNGEITGIWIDGVEFIFTNPQDF